MHNGGTVFVAVLRIRIHFIRMFLGLLDPDPLVIKVRILLLVRKTLIPIVLTFICENDGNVPSKSNKQKNFSKLVFCWRLEGQ